MSNPLAHKQFVDEKVAADRRKKILERNCWILVGKKCMNLSNEIKWHVLFSHTYQDKWNAIEDQFTLMYFYIKHPTILGHSTIDQTYAKYLKEIAELEPGLMRKIRSKAHKKGIKITAHPCHKFHPPFSRMERRSIITLLEPLWDF